MMKYDLMYSVVYKDFHRNISHFPLFFECIVNTLNANINAIKEKIVFMVNLSHANL